MYTYQHLQVFPYTYDSPLQINTNNYEQSIFTYFYLLLPTLTNLYLHTSYPYLNVRKYFPKVIVCI